MASGCGSWGQVSAEMGLPEYYVMCRHWLKSPPAHVIAAAKIGYKPPKTVAEQQAEGAMGPEDFAAWCKLSGGRISAPG